MILLAINWFQEAFDKNFSFALFILDVDFKIVHLYCFSNFSAIIKLLFVFALGDKIINSSPPYLAIISVERTVDSNNLASSLSKTSPAACPLTSL